MAKWIGAHVSASGGVYNAPINARRIQATAVGLFTKNQMQWKAKDYTQKTIDRFREELAAGGYTGAQVLPHATYLINLGSPSDETREKSIAAITDELSRCEQLGVPYLNFHPGSSKGEIEHDECLNRIADGINRALSDTTSAILVLENTAGAGSTKGRTIEELAAIIDRVKNPERVGICIDTCHAFAAGHPIHTEEGWDALLEEIDRRVGLRYLVGLHLNDSKTEFASNKDRHAPIGAGHIGLEGFVHIVRDSRSSDIPMILETPEPQKWSDEIAVLTAIAGGRTAEEAVASVEGRAGRPSE
ncbi:MAG: deoxyribonuclease IV [Spirochaetales bacterium]